VESRSWFDTSPRTAVEVPRTPVEIRATPRRIDAALSLPRSWDYNGCKFTGRVYRGRLLSQGKTAASDRFFIRIRDSQPPTIPKSF
jgi:hypothetical protein